MKYLFTLVFLGINLCAMAQGRDRFEKGGDKGNTEDVEETEQQPTKQKLKEPGKESLLDNLVFGGSASAQFGTNTFVLVAPRVGYKVTDKYTVGTGFIYQYASYASINTQTGTINRGAIRTSTYGPLLFNYYNVTDFAYVGAQFEYLNHDLFYYIPSTGDYTTERVWTPVLFLEVGYTQTIGKKGAIQLGIKYNVLHQENQSPYGSAWFPVIGFFF